MPLDKQLARVRWTVWLAFAIPAAAWATGVGDRTWGPLLHEFPLTAGPGRGVEALGPFYQNYRGSESNSIWAVPPILSYSRGPGADHEEFEVLYPLFTYDRFGGEYRVQLMQLFSVSGGPSAVATNANRVTLFPFYFQQRSDNPDLNYTGVIPFYGRLKNRLFRDESRWVLWPVYIQSRKRDVVTDNFLYPLVHRRRGDGLDGWQFWPLVGWETKAVTYTTNHWGELDLRGGHDKRFALWPIFFRQTTGLGTTNVDRRQILLPFYSLQRSEARDSITVPWPLGFSRTEDRQNQYREWAAPWPLIVFARGEGKTTDRVLPFYSRSHNRTLEQGSVLWPVYRYRHVRSDPLDRKRTSILFFLYADVNERNTATGASKHRHALWPLFTSRHDSRGNRRVQVFAPLEPILPHNESIERNYSPLWSVWRSERNAETGGSSQSFLWNLYRRDATPESKKCSLLFGLFQYQTTPDSRRWRLFYVPFGQRATRDNPSIASP